LIPRLAFDALSFQFLKDFAGDWYRVVFANQQSALALLVVTIRMVISGIAGYVR
jgi:hypothetical protein